MTLTPGQLCMRFGFAASLVVCVALALHLPAAASPPTLSFAATSTFEPGACAPASPQDRGRSFGSRHDRDLVDTIAEDGDEDDGDDARCRAVAHTAAFVVMTACGPRDCPSLAFVAVFPPPYDARPLRAPPQ